MSAVVAHPPPTTVRGPLPGLSALYFPGGIPGFREARHFTVGRWGEEPNVFVVLQSWEAAGLRFVAVEPAMFFPWYKPAFGPEVYQAVEVAPPVPGQDGEVAKVAVLVLLTLRPEPELITANLVGPLVINPSTGTATQAVVSEPGYSTATPLPPRL